MMKVLEIGYIQGLRIGGGLNEAGSLYVAGKDHGHFVAIDNIDKADAIALIQHLEEVFEIEPNRCTHCSYDLGQGYSRKLCCNCHKPVITRDELTSGSV